MISPMDRPRRTDRAREALDVAREGVGVAKEGAEVVTDVIGKSQRAGFWLLAAAATATLIVGVVLIVAIAIVFGE